MRTQPILGALTQLNAARRARAVDQATPWDDQVMYFILPTAKDNTEIMTKVHEFPSWPKGWKPRYSEEYEMQHGGSNVSVVVLFNVTGIATPGDGAFVRATLNLMA